MSAFALSTAAGLVVGWLLRAVWWDTDERALMLRKALAESVAQADERLEEMQVMNAELEALEKEARAWEAVARNVAQAHALVVQDERLDADTRAALARSFPDQVAAHSLIDRRAA